MEYFLPFLLVWAEVLLIVQQQALEFFVLFSCRLLAFFFVKVSQRNTMQHNRPHLSGQPMTQPVMNPGPQRPVYQPGMQQAPVNGGYPRPNLMGANPGMPIQRPMGNGPMPPRPMNGYSNQPQEPVRPPFPGPGYPPQQVPMSNPSYPAQSHPPNMMNRPMASQIMNPPVNQPSQAQQPPNYQFAARPQAPGYRPPAPTGQYPPGGQYPVQPPLAPSFTPAAPPSFGPGTSQTSMMSQQYSRDSVGGPSRRASTTGVDPDHIPSPVAVQETDQAHWDSNTFGSLSRISPPLATSQYRSVDEGKKYSD
jgi:hypothetical protein